VIQILGQDLAGEDYSVPDWSPDGAWIAIGIGNTSGVGGKQIEIMKPDGTDIRQVTENLSFTNASYHWSPVGSVLVYQRLRIDQSNNGPEILTWDLATGESRVLAENTALPQWMP